ncbi:MAG: hypothetical protein U0871_10755 [Gemmataceae bacterium]
MQRWLANLVAVRGLVALLLALSPLISPALAVGPVGPAGQQQTGQSEEHEERQGESRPTEAVGCTALPRRYLPIPLPTGNAFVLPGTQAALAAYTPVRSSLDPFHNGLGTPYRC